MKILVINCGSSSLKYQLIDMASEKVMAKGTFERIGQPNSFLTHKVNGEKYKLEKPVQNHEEALEFSLEQLLNPEYKVIDSLEEINATGHRVVHGGEKFNKPVIINEEVISTIEECASLAPLHNPAAVMGIKAAQKLIPNKPMVAVFDTAFHQTMPKEHYIYPIPYKYYNEYGVRKYGFHGTSHQYVANRVAELEGKPIEDLRIISCHLGQGGSICAVQGGRSVETSMGLTPLAGIPMGTRSGDIDPSVVTFIMKKEGLTPDEMERILNKESGILALSGVTQDCRDMEAAAAEGNEQAALAIKIHNYLIAAQIAKCAVAMNGFDVMLFTAGIGENQKNIRKGICENLKFLGVEIDDERNDVKGEERLISSDNSKIKVYVVPTDEELMIAKQTLELIK